MLFNSYVFLFVFLPVTWISFRLAGRLRLTNVVLVTLILASLIFYSYSDPTFVLLILLSVAFNYSWGKLLVSSRTRRRLLLAIGIGINVGVLSYFKYTNFLLSNLCELFHMQWVEKDIFLPLGISFFTFQQITYLTDRYTGAARKSSLLQYAAYVTFFPKMTAGPIVRHREIVPQYGGLRLCAMSYRNIGMGLGFMALGLFKKTVIADNLSPWVDDVFGTADTLTFVEAWGGALAYTFQIYFDFSAYSDMAIGVARLFNIRLPINFNSPYKATSVIDFWRRWHITLSRFLRDYLYIPLGGNRKGVARQHANLLVTMLIGGLWHGAAWTFVVWGGLHGVFLCLNHVFRRLARRFALHVPAWTGWAMTFACVNMAWVFFRAESLRRAVDILKGMVGMNGMVVKSRHLPDFLVHALQTLHITVGSPETSHFVGPRERTLILVAMLIAFAMPNTWQWVHQDIGRRPKPATAFFVGVILCISVLFLGKVNEFLYFQF